MSSDIFFLSGPPTTEGSLKRLTRSYGRAFEWLPDPISNFFMIFPFLIYMFSPTRRAAERKMEEQEKRKNRECLSESFELQTQVKELQELNSHYHMLADKFERNYNVACKSRDNLERKDVEVLKSLTNTNSVIQRQGETISKQAETISNMVANEQCLHSELNSLSALNLSQQQLSSTMLQARDEQDEKIDELQSEVEKLKRKQQTAPGSKVCSENTLINWKDGPIQNILLCAFYLGDYWASGRKNLQRKEVDAVCRTIEELSGHNAHESPRDFLWDNYQSWFKKKYLWNQLKSM